MLRQLGRVAHDVGAAGDAERWAGEALHIYRELNEWHQTGHAYDQLGEAACEQHEFERAAERFSEATHLLRQAGCEEGETSTLYHLARLAQAQGDVGRARTRCLNALRLMDARGVRREVGFAVELLAIVTVGEHPQRAARLLGAAERVREALGIALPPLDRDEHQRALSAARVALSATVFEQAWESGRAMSSGEVVTFALADAVEPAAVSSRPESPRVADGARTRGDAPGRARFHQPRDCGDARDRRADGRVTCRARAGQIGATLACPARRLGG